MLNSQSISISQKWKMWKEHKEEKFKQLSGSRSAMFNYFYNHNDIFKFIDKPDFIIYSRTLFQMMNQRTYLLVGSFFTVVLADRLILNKFFPRIRFKQWRLTANVIKYILWPVALYQPIDHFYFRNQRELLYTIQEKYNFGFQDYIKGNKIFERALAVNRLEELLDKREKFDWTGVPELQQ